MSRWIYDDQGRLSRYESDWLYNRDAPDTPEEIFTALAHTESGAVERWSLDLDADGLEDQRRVVARDPQGRVLRTTTTGTGDAGGDHLWVRRLRPDDQVLEEWVDWYADGSQDDHTTWTYDAQGRPLSSARDWDGDGRPDESATWGYDEAGRLQNYMGESARGVVVMTARGPCAP